MKKTDPLCLNWSPLSKDIFILRKKSSNKKNFKLKTRLSGDHSREGPKEGYRIFLFIQNDDNKKIPMVKKAERHFKLEYCTHCVYYTNVCAYI